MPNALNIKKNDPNIPSWWLFKALREKGLEHIAAFSGELWTDHNLHDPGITILEVLCYAISDLGYRTNLGIEELLAPVIGESEDNFFTPEQILTCNPLTILDYRKMLVDIPGVRNAWLLPSDEQEVPLYIDCDKDQLQFSPVINENKGIGTLVLNGLYSVFLELDPLLENGGTANCEVTSSDINTVLQTVRKRLHSHRNLCEDFLNIIVLQDEQIGLCADIELAPNANPDVVLEAVYEAIENFLSPRLDFFSLKEMIAKGKSLEEIFEGRPYTPAYGDKSGKFSHGFIDTDQLKNTDLPKRLLASDFYRVIMGVEGVRAIKSLLLNNYKDGIPKTNGEEWALELTKNHRPLFAPELSTFNFSKGVIRISGNRQRAINRFKKRLQDFRKNKFESSELDGVIPYGQNRSDLPDYKSIQHEFPLTYGIGKGHLSDKAPEKRKVEALQLKAYLTFYDQLLAGYLSQLANIRQLFAWNLPNGESGQTYFQQAVHDIPKADKIFLSVEQPMQGQGWNEGEVLALPLKPYSHPTERDMAIIQLIGLFSTFSSVDEKKLIDVVEEEGEYRFFVIGNNAAPVLQSKVTYESREKAMHASEALFFQGTLAQSYQPTNWPELSEYSFSLVYQSVSYTEYLKSITETPAAYDKRKDQFLNHLLARFGEQFTEYVLLMYALNQGAPDPKDIIQDKARFLTNYPDVSRNRGRGFDYTRKDDIWNSKDNISGFEKRVAGLMGLDNWERRYLNNFEVVLRDQQYVLTIKDHRGTVLFETVECYIQDEIDKASTDFNKLLADEAKYEPFECLNQNVYGFRLLGTDGKVFANYPRTFGSAALRDEIMACTKTYFNSDIEGFLSQVMKIVKEEEGFYFLLLAADGQAVYMKSSRAYATERAACYAWGEFIELAKIESNYRLTEGSYKGGPYSFVIYKSAEEGEGLQELAFHPKGYRSKRKREKIKEEVSKFVCSQKIAYEICRQPSLYAWSYVDENGRCLLSGFEKFETKGQALDAWVEFKAIGIDRTNYKEKPETEEGFSFTVSREEIPVAYSPAYPTAQERDQALDAVVEKIQTTTFLQETDALEIQEDLGAFFFVVLGEDQELALRSSQYFDTAEAATCAYFHFLENASLASSYQEVVQEETGLFSFKVGDLQTELAYHPEYYTKAEKETVQANLINYIQTNKLPFKLAFLPEAHHYELAWENCEGRCETLFVENGNHPTEADAQEEVFSFLSAYVNNELENWQVLQEEGYFNFVLKDDLGNILVTHPQFYEKESQAISVMEDAQDYMNNYVALQSEEKTLISAIPKWKICGNSFEEEKGAGTQGEEETNEACLLSGFQLGKTDAPIAYHPTIFDNLKAQTTALEELLRQAQCDQLDYSKICLQGSRIIAEIDGKFHFELWQSDAPILLWRSAHAFNSKAEATTAFQENWLRIIELTRNADNFRLPTPAYPYLSLWEAHQCIAYFPNTLSSEAEATEMLNDLCEIAKRYPLYAKNNQYGFRLLNEENEGNEENEENEENNAILWESTGLYPSIKEAFHAFTFFLSLLKNKINYRRNNNKEACRFKIEISEVLLESNRTYADAFRTYIMATYAPVFEREELAEEALSAVICATQSALSIDQSSVYKEGDSYGFRLNDSEDATIELWRSERLYSTEAEAQDAFNLAKKQWLHCEKYIIRKIEDKKYVIVIVIVIQDIQVRGDAIEDAESGTNFAACPALYEADTIKLGVDQIPVSVDCRDYDNMPCIRTICPAAWDEGLQSFLIHGTNESNYYPFVDYQQACQYGFRVVTDKYRVARNVEEFHLPAHQAQYKDWLYGYSRCQKDTVVELPIARLCKRNGQYHYYLEGDWISFQAYDTEAIATQVFNDELFDFYAYAQEVDFYALGTEDAPGSGRPLQLLRDDGSILALSIQRYQSTEDWNTAVLERILLARKFPYFYENGKYGFQCFALEEIPVFELRDRTSCDSLLPELPRRLDCNKFDTSDIISVAVPGGVIWESIHEYNSFSDAQCVFEAFLKLLQDKQNYQSIQLEDCNLFGLEITHPDEVLATHPQRHLTRSALHEAIKRAQDCINAEGFHLIEHILLRPKQGFGEHITIQFLGKENLDCADEEETTLFEERPYLLIEQVFVNEANAQVFKDMLIDRVVSYFKDEQGNLNEITAEDLLIQLRSDQKYPFVIDNLPPLVEALIRTYQSSADQLEAQFRSGLARLIFCFNKSSSTSSDQLIPNCPDCENITPLSLEEASAEACTDPKIALVERGSQANTSTDYYIAGADPYSFWTTIILPYWPKRFQNANFRNFFEDTLRREAPAHIGLKICWLDPKQMRRFERAYRQWLEAYSSNENCHLQDAQNRLIHILFDEKEGISNVYPPARLQESGCAPGGTSDAGAVLLDFTQLG